VDVMAILMTELYKGYIGSYTWSEEDSIYHGRVNNLANSIITFEGKTLEEVEADFKQAVDDYIDCIS
jgi:predicted HicB family RNase H-like nuclease